MSFWNFKPYESVASKKKKAEKKLMALKKKNPNINPVLIEGTQIAKTWWGKAWNSNLEKYADFEYRLDRGRSYVRHGAVLDLQIEKGKIKALVLGSSSGAYTISIAISPLTKTKWASIKKKCQTKIHSLQDLLAGKFPKDLSVFFTKKEEGLFPIPKEIKFECSCPDWASMCKHVAAALYGIGARFDENPSLFFTLRGVQVEDLVSSVIALKKEKLLKSVSGKRTSKVIKDESNLEDIFGIELSKEKSTQKKLALKKKSRPRVFVKKKT